MNNRGFTLIELIAIVLILGIIFLIGFPVLTNMQKQNHEKKYESMVSDLCTAGRSYMNENLDKYTMLSEIGSTFELKILELVEYGNVEKSLVNPKTKLSIENGTLKYTVLDDYTLQCDYIEE